MNSRDLKVHLIVGRRNVGKSHLINEFIDQIGANRCIVFDPNSEHSKSCSVDKFETVDEFMAEIYEIGVREKKWKEQPVYIFVEESTAYFRSKKDKSPRDEAMISRNRHLGIEFYFIFHSLRSIPLWILEYADNIFLFKTTDKKNAFYQAWKKYPKVVEAFEKYDKMTLKQSKGKFTHIIL